MKTEAEDVLDGNAKIAIYLVAALAAMALLAVTMLYCEPLGKPEWTMPPSPDILAPARAVVRELDVEARADAVLRELGGDECAGRAYVVAEDNHALLLEIRDELRAMREEDE